MITFKVENLKGMNGSLQNFVDFLKAEQVPDDALFSSKVVSCELITNVIRHCGEAANFCADIEGQFIEISVSSEGVKKCQRDKTLNPQLPNVFAESGRGLYIVKMLCFGDIESDGNSVKVKIKMKS
jgi:anti-sigma regulatory factor (Ser/Thr protein kinase)